MRLQTEMPTAPPKVSMILEMKRKKRKKTTKSLAAPQSGAGSSAE